MDDKDVAQGQPIRQFTAEEYNEIVAHIEALENLQIAAPLQLHRSAGMMNLSVSQTLGFYALLSGSTSPYSWTEKVPQPGLTWTTGPRSGTSNAYEVNGTSSLNGKYDYLIPDNLGGYRFQFIRTGGATGPCGSVCIFPVYSVCGTPTTIPIGGALVTLKKSGTIVNTCTATGGIGSITRSSGGSGYTTAPTISFTGGGGSGAAATCTVVGGVVQSTFAITSPGSGYTSAPTVVFTPTSGGSGAAASAALAYGCCIPITSAGTAGQYVATIHATGYSDATVTFGAVPCTGTSSTTMQAALTPFLTAGGCIYDNCNTTPPITPCQPGGAGVPGATVTVTNTTTGDVANLTTNSGGGYTVTLPPGSWTITATHPRYSGTLTETVTATACVTPTIPAMGFTTAASGYTCCSAPCNLPLATTLNVQDPLYGTIVCSFTTTWNADLTALGVTGCGWFGSLSASVGACGHCGGAAGVQIYYVIGGGKGQLTIYWHINNAGCPCGTGTLGCPGSPFPFGSAQYNAGFTVTCPPSYLVSGTITGGVGSIYCGNQTITITE